MNNALQSSVSMGTVQAMTISVHVIPAGLGTPVTKVRQIILLPELRDDDVLHVDILL